MKRFFCCLFSKKKKKKKKKKLSGTETQSEASQDDRPSEETTVEAPAKIKEASQANEDNEAAANEELPGAAGDKQVEALLKENTQLLQKCKEAEAAAAELREAADAQHLATMQLELRALRAEKQLAELQAEQMKQEMLALEKKLQEKDEEIERLKRAPEKEHGDPAYLQKSPGEETSPLKEAKMAEEQTLIYQAVQRHMAKKRAKMQKAFDGFDESVKEVNQELDKCLRMKEAHEREMRSLKKRM